MRESLHNVATLAAASAPAKSCARSNVLRTKA